MRTIFSRVMWVARATVLTVGLAVILAVTVALATTALAAAPGDPFKLARTKAVNKVSTLVGKAASPMLRIENNGGGTALDLQVRAGKPPMEVNSAAKVGNLNADQVDGLDSSQLAGEQGPPGPQGEPGSALAYAHIRADGTFDPDRSRNVRASFRQSPGRYCIDFTVQEPLNVVATIDSISTPGEIRQRTEPGAGNFQCPGVPGGPYKVLVLTTNSAGTAFEDKVFDIAVN